jgi:hypothetical protein
MEPLPDFLHSLNVLCVCFPTDADQQCGGERSSETSDSPQKELNFRTAKQRMHSFNKRQPFHISEIDKSHDTVNVFSSNQMDHRLSESDNTSGEIFRSMFLVYVYN